MAIRGKLLSKLDWRNRFLIRSTADANNLQRSKLSISSNFQLSYCNSKFGRSPFVYVNLRARFRFDRCLSCHRRGKKREEAIECKYFFIHVSRTRNVSAKYLIVRERWYACVKKKRNDNFANSLKEKLCIITRRKIWRKIFDSTRVNFQLKVIKLLENQSIFFSINFQIFFDRNEMSKKKYFHT